MVLIRPYCPEDLEEVVQLWWRTWHETFPKLTHPQSYTTWIVRFRDEIAVQGLVWVAELENKIIGFVVVMEQKRYLDQIFVDTRYQNQGIGSMLIEKAKEACPLELNLHTLQQNIQASAFYERHGFKASKLGINKINGQPNY
ncbi:MAG: GNAT family N-acetyltransferase [Pelatocladus maniniholoensis HA4357-MV3]|jgi:ribosomal protein S18 acetylase RimI-like enzyme|uniref:GNAT family N-acetyltransferase n=1 Tax=Pelatocladus maniniholoensis HA4357-MV3 TaxID=1117104 RepID=A0A9E3H768_9NOST|nr:GNAT family N-acetyltransferase [Pelatocladus maniniholoensis HA4357-MV3]